MASLSALACPCKSNFQDTSFLSKKGTTSFIIKNLKPTIDKNNSKLGHLKRNYPKIEQSLKQTLNTYVESGRVEDAMILFDKLDKSGTAVWNYVIEQLTNRGLFHEAIEFYLRMCIEGVRADNYTYPFVLKACRRSLMLIQGQKVHSRVIKEGFGSDVYICNSLITMYAKLGYIDFAEKVFDEMTVRDLVSWNSLVSAYLSVGDSESSLMCIQRMRASGIGYDRFTLLTAIGACSSLCSPMKGKEIHCQVIKNNLEMDIMVQTALIDMYGRCSNVNYAEMLFEKIPDRNIVAYNAMIGGYALNGLALKSFACLKKMQETGRLVPDRITLVNVLPSCAQIGAALEAKSVHAFSIRKQFLPHPPLEITLLTVYGKCGETKLANSFFHQIREKSLMFRNAMIAAHVQNNQNNEALEVFRCLLDEHLKPDSMTVSSILPAYAKTAQLKDGKHIHAYIVKLDMFTITFVRHALIYMYAKCGDLYTARLIFDEMPCKDIVSWNTIIMACAEHGFAKESFSLFSKMLDNGFRPNGSTFVSILSACSIAGMMTEGWQYFNLMKDYEIDPGVEHYGCMLDLLGRDGDLNLAKQFIEQLPCVPTSRIWGSFLAACRHHQDIELAELAAKNVLALEHDNTGCYILLANMYAEAGRWEDMERIRSIMNEKGIMKTVGSTALEVRGKIYRFTNQDRSHFQTDMIYSVLSIVSKKLGEDLLGHTVKFKPQDLQRKVSKSSSAKYHSVRLGICLGLISTSIGSPVLVRKNTRICEDCHVFVKKISEACRREITVGDSKIYHYFKDGQCSCKDYW